MMMWRRKLAIPWLLLCAVDARLGVAQGQMEGEPALLSVYPSAARRGQPLRVEIRGHHLEGARMLWASEPGLSGGVTGVEREAQAPQPKDDETKKPAIWRVFLDLDVNAAARIGPHFIRTVSRRGVSTAIRFEVLDAPVVLEQSTAHADPAAAQAVSPPCLVNGRLAKPGEADVFAFNAKEGERFSFRVTAAENFDPRVALFSRKASWFDDSRAVRLLFDEERGFEQMPIQAIGTFRAAQPGQYFVQVSSVFGKGCGECTYQLSVARDEAQTGAAKSEEGTWRERAFTRALTPEWIAAVGNRASGAAARHENLTAYTDDEQGRELRLPALISGVIGKPGEADTFRFRAEAGDKLAFEIETPQTPPPHFNPVVAVLDVQGRQILSNIQRRVSLFNNNAEVEGYLKDIEPKAIHTFQAGEYTLKVRDLTARYAGTSYAYRVLVRRQAPHVGEVTSPDLDHVNLTPGGSRKIALTAALEEGFTGDVVYSASGLPPGVTLLPAGRLIEEKAPRDLPENAETVLPGQYGSTLILAADPGLEPTAEPARVTIRFRPVVGGKPGSELLVREFPLMVVEQAKPEEKRK
ncbi:MAG: hypothetical protein FJW39_19855 [Acidobacteria bacterium]|nr:hypothetical protein [Acidobacteriota bacterium]